MKRITLALAVLVSLAFVAAASAATPAPFPTNKVNGVFVAASDRHGHRGGQRPVRARRHRRLPGLCNRHEDGTRSSRRSSRSSSSGMGRSRRQARRPRRPPSGPSSCGSRSSNDQQLKYTKVPVGLDARYRWAVSWKVPALYPVGTVQFQVFAKMWNKQSGTFAQLPISPLAADDHDHPAGAVRARPDDAGIGHVPRTSMSRSTATRWPDIRGRWLARRRTSSSRASRSSVVRSAISSATEPSSRRTTSPPRPSRFRVRPTRSSRR